MKFINRFYIVFFLFLLTSPMFVQDVKAQRYAYIKIGPNYSSFYTVASKPSFGTSYAYAGGMHAYKNMSIEFELNWTVNRVNIRDKIFGGSYVGKVYAGDINFSMAFLGLSQFFTFNWPISTNFSIQLLTGPFFRIGMRDKTTFSIKRYIREIQNLNEWNTYSYNYHYDPGEVESTPYPLKSSGSGLSLGVRLKWAHVSFDCRYSRDLFAIKNSNHIVLHEKLQAIEFLLGIDAIFLGNIFSK